MLKTTERGKKYEGLACTICGNVLRYINSNACVNCTKERNKKKYENNPSWGKPYRNAAKQQRKIDYSNQTIYEGRKCFTCENYNRYVATDECVFCKKEREKTRREKEKDKIKIYNEEYERRTKEERRNLYPNQVIFEGFPCPQCNTTEKYVSCGNCVVCSRKRARRIYKSNPKRYIENTSKWRKLNPKKTKASRARQNATRRSRNKAVKNDLTDKEWETIINLQNNKCLFCDEEFTIDNPPTRDHILPVSKGGGLTYFNTQALHKSCNSIKHNKHIDFRSEELKKLLIENRPVTELDE